jgi:dTDP-4-amino-4,6-dideoxygalactose transaminase
VSLKRAGEKGINELRGVNSRLDELQAAVLAMKLGRLDADNTLRRRAARFYTDHITNRQIVLPKETFAPEHVWHLFVIRCLNRNALQEHLRQAGVETFIHYPVPPHQQHAYREMNGLSFPVTEKIHREVLSLPLSPVITEANLCMLLRQSTVLMDKKSRVYPPLFYHKAGCD